LSNYRKKRLAELRDLCVDRGLDSRGNKQQLLLRLSEDDFDNDAGVVGNDDASDGNQIGSQGDSEDAEVTVVPANHTDDMATGAANSECMNLRALELQLALEQTRLERTRLECGSQTTVGNVAHARDLQASLPNMSHAGDVLAFFLCFEKTLKLNNVQQSNFHKYLPAHLNERCKKIFARLSYEQCIDYHFLKSEMISTASSSPKAYLAK
jgi:SAP domain